MDLLFASTGIEPEIVASAEALRIFEGLTAKVAAVGHIIACKVLSRDDETRPQDKADLAALLREATSGDLRLARSVLKLIRKRGFHRGRNLLAEFEALLRNRRETRRRVKN